MPASTISPRRAFTSLALVLGALSATACTGFSPGDHHDGPPAPPGPRNDLPQAPAVNGTPDKSEVTEAFGVFVAPTGQPGTAGSREHPLATIQAGIDLGKQMGKRVYVCTGTFREALVLASSISVIGGLDCAPGGNWRVGAAHTRIEAPTSPAVRASNITAPTRLEGIDILAPNATTPSGSSIGLLADHVATLVIAGSKITAGDGASGVDGTEGTQLTKPLLNSVNGENAIHADRCIDGQTCTMSAVPAIYPWLKPRGGAGGKSVCSGAPGHDGLPGGNGGSGGLYVPIKIDAAFFWQNYADSPGMAAELGQYFPGSAGAAGNSGVPSAALGALSAEGYSAANGAAGTSGAPGNGGFGGRGSIDGRPEANAVLADAVWTGRGGPGGGAGGCPGLAGTAGTGGGASIALALIDSPIVVDGTELISGKAGTAGRGSFGSDPTAGGAAGDNGNGYPINAARPGGSGGIAGISTNGSSGPSIGILHSGAAPVRASAKITTGQPGAAIDARLHYDPLTGIKIIPATPAGITKDILAL